MLRIEREGNGLFLVQLELIKGRTQAEKVAVVQEIVDAIPADPAAVVLDNCVGDPAFALFVQRPDDVEVRAGARLTGETAKDDAGMVAIVLKKLVVF